MAVPAGFPWPAYWAVPILVLVLASATIVDLVGNGSDCRLNEAFVDPCFVMGIDLGAPLTYMGIMGWPMLESLPFGAVLPLWLVAPIVHPLVHRRRKSAFKP